MLLHCAADGREATFCKVTTLPWHPSVQVAQLV